MKALRAATAHDSATAGKAMSEERRVTLKFLSGQQQRLLTNQRTLIDELHVQGAMVRRLDGTQGLILEELRAIHQLLARLVDRVRAVEDRGE